MAQFNNRMNGLRSGAETNKNNKRLPPLPKTSRNLTLQQMESRLSNEAESTWELAEKDLRENQQRLIMNAIRASKLR